MTASQDTEITLGTGRMLGLFFALVALCAVVFAMGFSLGKNSVKMQDGDSGAAPTVVQAGKRNSPTNLPRESKQTPDMTFYKSVGQSDTNSELAPAANSTAPADAKSGTDTSAAPPASGGYFVQVAAVSKQDDADTLVEALKKKQYNAVAAQTSSDKLFHVEVGPFAAIKDAENMRTQLLSDGYNPILKK